MKLKKILSCLLACTAIGNLTACGAIQETPAPAQVQSQNLTAAVEKQKISVTDLNDEFRNSQMNFAVNLFQETAVSHPEENMLVSPLSVMLALSMTANGAENQTKSQMESVLGSDIDTLNQNLYSYVQKLPSGEKGKLSIANSIWCRLTEDITIKPDFLQTDVNYYQADVYQENFSQETADNINTWVRENTDGMIDRVIDEISLDAFMYLINALAFDAEWLHIYEDTDIREGGTFTNADGLEKEVTMMFSSEYSYLESEQATGFIKPYAEGYSFAALLPNENINIDDYISSLDSETISGMFNTVQHTEVIVNMPKFRSEFSTSLADVLQMMGMTDAFTANADFSKMAEFDPKKVEYIDIQDIIHKTYIEVDERGTKAGAVTAVIMEGAEEANEPEPKFIILDRPFVYMIIDDENQLPVFLGTMKDIT